MEVLGWATSFSGSFLCSAKPELLAEKEADEYYPDLVKVLEKYHDFKEVFYKCRASALPLHRPYDCGINLLPGTTLPSIRFYSLLAAESQAMQKYIPDSFKAGIIRFLFSRWCGFLFCGQVGWFS